MVTRQAVILVGGKGTRLGSLAANAPKPLMQIDADTVFLDELILNIARQGFDDILLLAGHMHEQFTQRYHGHTIRGAAVRVIVEPAPAGTAGALRHAAGFLQQRFLFTNGDTLFDINLRALDPLFETHRGAMGAMALRRVEDPARYGSVRLDNAKVVAFAEKHIGGSEPGLINAGAAILSRDCLDLIDVLPCSIESDIYPQLVERGHLLGAEFHGYFIDIGLPDTLEQARQELPARRARPALFLDRDGVLNLDAGHTYRVEDLRWMPGAIEAIRHANDLGAIVIVVTNQAGVAKGFYTPEDVHRFHDAMRSDLAEKGAFIDEFRMCFFHPVAVSSQWHHPNHPDRKPNPGMILGALRDWPIDIEASILVGDRQSDLDAATSAGVASFMSNGDHLAESLRPWFQQASAQRTEANDPVESKEP